MKMLKKCLDFCSKPTLIIGVLLATTIGSQACELNAGWLQMLGNEKEEHLVSIKLETVPVPISKPFAVEIVVCSNDAEIIDRVVIDAIMPAHKHGMNYRPEIRKVDEVTYKASGMFFHMPGEWRISVDVYGQKSSRHFTLNVLAR
jgi:hypothetical protein